LPNYDGWEPLRDDRDPQREKTLGRPSGQGIVYLARSPERVLQLQRNAEEVKKLLRDATERPQHKDVNFSELGRKIMNVGSPDPVEFLGALKCYKIPADDKLKEARAVGCLKSEIRALHNAEHPAVLKLRHANPTAAPPFIVTQYHRRGSLGDNLQLYRGNVLAALNAFRKLVGGVDAIHKQSVVHRDIKPANIFVTESGDLVLGDFGMCVFFDAGTENRIANENRITRKIGELVGSHWWMPPWASTYDRVAMDKVNPQSTFTRWQRFCGR
jgi:serine/threonine protein kinase